MKVEYSRRAIADLHQISIASRRLYGDRIAEAFGLRIRAVVDRISRDPLSAPQVEQRPHIHVGRSFVTPSKSSIELSTTKSEFCTSDTRRGAHGQEQNERAQPLSKPSPNGDLMRASEPNGP